MKKLFSIVCIVGMMTASSTFAGQNDTGVPLADGLTNGVDTQAQMMKEMGPFALLLLPLTPLSLVGGVVVDTGEKLSGN